MKSRLSRKYLILLGVVANAYVGILINFVSDDLKNALTHAGVNQYSRIQIEVGLFITSLLVTTVILCIAEKNKSKDDLDELTADVLTETEKVRRKFLADLADRYENRYAH